MKMSLKLFVLFAILINSCFIFKVYCEDCGTGPRKCPRNTKYRSVDGSCNNLKNPKWGSTGTEYGRMLPAKFSDCKKII